MRKLALIAFLGAAAALRAQFVTGILHADADNLIDPAQNLTMNAALGVNDLIAIDGDPSFQAIAESKVIATAGFGLVGTTSAAWPQTGSAAASFEVTMTESIVVLPSNPILNGTSGVLTPQLLVVDVTSANTSTLTLSSSLSTQSFNVTTGNLAGNPVSTLFPFVYGVPFSVTFFAEDPIKGPGSSKGNATSEIVDWGLGKPSAVLEDSPSGQIFASSVPEPLSLFSLGIPALLVLRRRARRR